MPEVSKQPLETTVSPEIQLQELRTTLSSHGIFKELRGRFGGTPYDKFLEGGSPTETVRLFNDWAGKQRVMLQLLAKYQRNGWMVAYNELHSALFDSSHVITGEDVAAEKTTPGTLIIVDFEKVALIARWAQTTTRDDVEYLLSHDGELNPERRPRGALTKKLFEAVPEFQKFWSSNPSYGRRDTCPTQIREKDVRDYWTRIIRYAKYRERLFLFVNGGYWRDGYAVGAFIRDSKPRDVLKLFSRKERKRISAWSFNYPTAIDRDIPALGRDWYRMWIGFHEQSEHEKWRQQWPNFVSTHANHGFGAIMLDEEMTGKKEGASLETYGHVLDPYSALGSKDPAKLKFHLAIGHEPE